MSLLNLSCGLILLFVVEAYYYQRGSRYYNRNSGFYARYSIRENIHRDPWMRERSNSLRRRNERYQEAQRRPGVRNTEKGPRRSRTEDYQRTVGRPAVRNTEKGPRRSRTEVGYQRPGRPAVRNREKGPRRSSRREVGYQRPGRPAVRNREKGPRRSGTAVGYQRPGRPAVRNREKGPRRSGTAVGYQRPARPAARNREKGPRRTRTEDQRRRSQARSRGQDYHSRRRQNGRGSAYDARSNEPEEDTSDQTSSSGVYKGCYDRDRFCFFWKRTGHCKRKRCDRTCGLCAPLSLICTHSSRFGCCWDGSAAWDENKSNCRDCVDKNWRICHRPAVYRECDLHEANTLNTRKLCPQTCGACYDYSVFAR